MQSTLLKLIFTGVLTIKRPGLVRDLPPGKEELRWVANSSTLISGERDAILVDTLNPTAVIAGHKRAENDDSPRIIEETRQYIRDFDRLAETTATARELYDTTI